MSLAESNEWSEEMDFDAPSGDEHEEEEEADLFDADEPAPSTREPDYHLLARSAVVSEQHKHISRIAEVLGLTLNQARVLLMHFEWDAERVLTVFFDKGKDALYMVRCRAL
jgi:ariadne-1